MAKEGLTKNDQIFIDEYFNNGFNGALAYRTTFRNSSLTSSKFEAYRLLAKPFIKKEVEKRFDEIKDLNIIKREELVIALKELMLLSIQNQDNIILLKTIDTINKMQGNYTTLLDANINHTINLSIPGLDDNTIKGIIEEQEEQEED